MKCAFESIASCYSGFKRTLSLVFLTLAGCGVGSVLSAAGSYTDLKDVAEMWKSKRYLEVLQVLKEYRQGPYGKTPEVDYMIASSMCRLPEYQARGQRYFQWLLYNHPLDEHSRAQVLDEMNNCASAKTPLVINFVVVRSGTGARVGGKMFYPITSDNLPVSSVPVQVVREIPAAEMAERLAPISSPATGIDKVKTLTGPGAVVEAHGHFLLAKKAASEDGNPGSGFHREKLRSPTALADFGKVLENYLKFFSTKFKMRIPTNFIAVYCLADSDSVQQMAESLHGIRVSKLSIGYSYRDDLSLVGLFDGTLIHELFHLLVHNDFGDIPPWLDEGTAALYEVSKVRSDGSVEGVDNWRGEVLRYFWSSRPSLEQLIRMDWSGFDDKAGNHRSDRQAVNHATARYFMLLLQERRQLGDVYHAFRNRKVEDLQTDPRTEAVQLVEKATGKSVAALDEDFAAWFKKNFKPKL